MEIHIVQSGDTVWKIAQIYGVSPQRIIADNGLVNPDVLVVGQAILILYPDRIHIVRAGDTLGKIAVQYNTTVMSLIQNNPELVLNPALNVGQELTIAFKVKRDREITINGYAYPYVNQRVLIRTLPYLSMLTIFGYGITASGELIEIDDEPLISLARQFKVAPIMLLSSVTEDGTFNGGRASYIFNNLEAQNLLISKIIEKMKQKGYYGLDVDFEYIEPSDAQAYINFVQNITAQLNEQGFTVNVDLAPKNSAQQRGLLYEAHNYLELGKAANTVLLMTYEWGYTYGPPMAVAPINNVRGVIEYALTEIPSNKIFMGVPNYGYDWELPYQRGVTRATSIGNDYAVTFAAQNNAQIQFDETAQSPFYEYWNSQGKQHVVWFEDVRSIKSKLDLMVEKDLLGLGYWNVMRLFVSNWMMINAMFNIKKFI